MRQRHIQIAVTVVCLIAVAAHLRWPKLVVDTTTAILLVVAVIPWLAPLVKSVELPGGFKIVLQDLRAATAKADQAGLLAPPGDTRKYTFQRVAHEDPNLSLAGLRIEIEKRLVELAESRGLAVERLGVKRLLDTLKRQDILAPGEYGALDDMVTLLNRAAHGAVVDQRAANWAIDIGPRILEALDDRLEKQSCAG